MPSSFQHLSWKLQTLLQFHRSTSERSLSWERAFGRPECWFPPPPLFYINLLYLRAKYEPSWCDAASVLGAGWVWRGGGLLRLSALVSATRGTWGEERKNREECVQGLKLRGGRRGRRRTTERSSHEGRPQSQGARFYEVWPLCHTHTHTHTRVHAHTDNMHTQARTYTGGERPTKARLIQTALMFLSFKMPRLLSEGGVQAWCSGYCKPSWSLYIFYEFSQQRFWFLGYCGSSWGASTSAAAFFKALCDFYCWWNLKGGAGDAVERTVILAVSYFVSCARAFILVHAHTKRSRRVPAVMLDVSHVTR